MSSDVDGYLREIEDSAYVSEVLAERFDNALDFLTPSSVVYGGAVRDVLAGMKLLGDLDVAVSVYDMRHIRTSFLENPKWVAVGMPIFTERKYPGALAAMTEVSQLTNIDGATVQLVTSASTTGNNLEDAIDLARKVDIVCCGVVLMHNGLVYEALPGALEDCRNRVLRINKMSDTMFVDALPGRVKKLVGRGWKSEINVRAALATATKKRGKYAKKAVTPHRYHGTSPRSSASDWEIKILNYSSKKMHDPGARERTLHIKPDHLAMVLERLNKFAIKRNTLIEVRFRKKAGIVILRGNDNIISPAKADVRSMLNGEQPVHSIKANPYKSRILKLHKI